MEEDHQRDHFVQSVEAIASLYEKAEKDVTRHQRGVESVARFFARPRSLYVVLSLFAGWIIYNAAALHVGLRAFDPPPFHALQGIVTLCALLMTLMVLIKQGRADKVGDQRAHLDLQVNLIAEKKIAKLIALMEELRRDLPSVTNRSDPEAEAMQQPADPQVLANILQESIDDAKKDE